MINILFKFSNRLAKNHFVAIIRGLNVLHSFSTSEVIEISRDKILSIHCLVYTHSTNYKNLLARDIYSV